MSIGSYLLTQENIGLVAKKSWKFGREEIMALGLRYYEDHPTEVDVIVQNLNYMGLTSQGAALDAVLEGITAHYYEKLFLFVKNYEAIWIARNRIEVDERFAWFQEAKDTGKAVFLAQSHFGATYFMGITLTARGLPINVVGNFPEPAGSLMHQQNQLFVEKYGTGNASVINIADPKLDIAMEMLRCFFKKEIVTNVYDENNEFSGPQTLLGKTVYGGSGMNLLLRHFNDDRIMILTPFLIRTSNETFRYELDRHYLSGGDIVKSFYSSLEKRVRAYPEQWYFIHELHDSLHQIEKGASEPKH